MRSLVIGSGIAEGYHKRLFDAVALLDGVIFQSQTETICGFNDAGPKSRHILQRLTNASLNSKDFRFMRSNALSLEVSKLPH